ncbi:DUF2304 domain-containing protein [Cryobacterium melibiosiphilum]|uniref:DUF2304 domain-containing protein n=1 Tax=Cryobacterium melibiosiphilum TaxID=995039 RepID=A0A3A5MFB6_9MICO|nr:DUF2304 domain-containing protein [Cryobacterium melibiosiphilum]RJT87805.1 DUF2304 domain-containing protein [Cryobacterium melibiosiphilum]
MDVSQILIKAVLITVFALLGLVILLPRRGARGMAIRRLTMVAVLVSAVIAIIFPDLTNAVAFVLGVGRGTDLLLYGLIVVFLGFAVTSSAHNRRLDRQITDLARQIALAEAGAANEAHTPTEDVHPA